MHRDTRVGRDPDPYRLYAAVRTDLGMTAGKIVSQAGHAYVDAILEATNKRPDEVDLWRDKHHGIKVCLAVRSLMQLYELKAECDRMGIFCSVIEDLGFTVFDGKPTITAIGLGPIKRSQAGPVLDGLRLLP